jgi:hypothetical protein
LSPEALTLCPSLPATRTVTSERFQPAVPVAVSAELGLTVSVVGRFWSDAARLLISSQYLR